MTLAKRPEESAFRLLAAASFAIARLQDLVLTIPTAYCELCKHWVVLQVHFKTSSPEAGLCLPNFTPFTLLPRSGLLLCLVVDAQVA